MDFRDRQIHPKSDPPDAGTEHLFQQKLSLGYEKVIIDHPHRAVRIDGNATIDEVFDRILSAFNFFREPKQGVEPISQ